MKQRQYVNGFLNLSYAVVFPCCLIMIVIFKDTIDWDEKILIGSKILTIVDQMLINNFKSYPKINFNSNGTYNKYHQNYEYLLIHSKKECEENFKKVDYLIHMKI